MTKPVPELKDQVELSWHTLSVAIWKADDLPTQTIKASLALEAMVGGIQQAIA